MSLSLPVAATSLHIEMESMKMVPEVLTGEIYIVSGGKLVMAKRKSKIPEYGTTLRSGIEYYRIRVKDADGKMLELYALTKEELYQKETAARLEKEEVLFRRENPTVAEYCEKWLLICSETVSKNTIRDYETIIRNYIIKPLGDL